MLLGSLLKSLKELFSEVGIGNKPSNPRHECMGMHACQYIHIDMRAYVHMHLHICVHVHAYTHP